MRNQTLLTLFRIRGEWVSRLNRLGAALAALAIFLVAAHSLRLSLFALFVLLFFGGSLALQFDIRHAFHLQFMAWWAALFIVNAAILSVWKSERRARAIALLRAPKSWYGVLRRPVGLVAAIAAALLVPLYPLRLYQDRSLERLFEKYESAPVEEGAWVVEQITPPNPAIEGNVILIPQAANLEDRPDGQVASDYLVIEIGGIEGEAKGSLSFTALFESSHWRSEYSRKVILRPPAHGETTKVFLPIFTHRASQNLNVSSSFKGIVLAEADLPYVRGIHRVRDTAGMRLLPSLILPPDWRDLPHYQTFLKPGRRRNWILSSRLEHTPVLGQSILRRQAVPPPN